MSRKRDDYLDLTDEEFASMEECYPVGELVDLEPETCECGRWTVGESRCECGNIRPSIVFSNGIPYVEAS